MDCKASTHSVLGHVGGDIHVRCAVGGEVWGTVLVDPTILEYSSDFLGSIIQYILQFGTYNPVIMQIWSYIMGFY